MEQQCREKGSMNAEYDGHCLSLKLARSALFKYVVGPLKLCRIEQSCVNYCVTSSPGLPRTRKGSLGTRLITVNYEPLSTSRSNLLKW